MNVKSMNFELHWAKLNIVYHVVQNILFTIVQDTIHYFYFLVFEM